MLAIVRPYAALATRFLWPGLSVLALCTIGPALLTYPPPPIDVALSLAAISNLAWLFYLTSLDHRRADRA